jgi:nucleoside phosphorylase
VRQQDERLVVVLTALPAEYRAVRAQLTDVQRVRHEQGTGFEVGRLREATVRVALARAGEGNASAAVVAERAIARFRPAALFFVGVASSLVDYIRLGDVVVATKTYAPDGGVQRAGELYAQPQAFWGAYELVELAQYLGEFEDWRGQDPDGAAGGCAVHFRPIAASEARVESVDTPLGNDLHEHFNDAVAVEKGSFGAAQAAHYNRSLPVLTVRGISEAADGTGIGPGIGGLELAAGNAARFAAAVIRAWVAGDTPAETPPEASAAAGRFGAASATPAPAASPEPRRPRGRDELGALARAASVAILGAARAPGASAASAHRLWGSGVLVAPGWVATCASVFEDGGGGRRGAADGEEIGVRIEGRTVRARVAYLPAPGRRGSAEPELALLALLGRIPEQRIAWLGERDPIMCERAVLYGHQDPGTSSPEGAGAETGPATAPDAGTLTAPCRVDGRDRALDPVDGPAELPPGFAGGPLVDSDRGEVVGVAGVRRGRVPDRAVPLDALHRLRPEHRLPGAPDLGAEPWRELLRRHDLWHLEQQDLPRRTRATWVDVRRELPGAPGSSWGPRDRLEELGWLARVAAPDRPEQVAQAMPPLPGRAWEDLRRPLLSWRDGYARLGDGQVEHLNFLVGVVRELDLAERRGRGGTAPVTKGFAEWVRARRRELNMQEQLDVLQVDPLPQAVLIEIEPLIGYGGRSGLEYFRWSIRKGYGAGEWKVARVGDDASELSLDNALGEVRDVLGGVLSTADGASVPARLEIAVPVERILPLAHEWRTPEGWQGTDREVVVRHAPRRGAPDPLWQERWSRLHGAGSLRARPVATVDDLEGIDDCEVPVVCRHGDRLGAAMAHALLRRGHAVAVWRGGGRTQDAARNGCAARDEDTACGDEGRGDEGRDDEDRGEAARDDAAVHARACTDFCHRVEGWLAAHTAGELPEGLRQLRRAARDGRRVEHAWVGEVVLLFDDPRNPLPWE